MDTTRPTPAPYQRLLSDCAQEAATRRRYRLSKLQRDGRLAVSIVARVRDAWSPEQIAGRLR
jgi:IS30 family transposase